MRWGIKVAVIIVLVLCAAPVGARAAAPLNDDFANAQSLSGSLPIEESGSNVGATSEPGEQTFGTYGHSVWFEWEAPDTGWFTIDACDSNFAASVGAFTGTALENLTWATPGGEGPDCGNRGKYTFRASEGTKYVIRVDGAVIAPPEGPPPPSEGTFTLRIAETPPPPNDDFANATVLESPVSEEPGGNRFYVLYTQGYNWNATTEPGEFPYGTNSGASVWFRWTPPETGTYRISQSCCGGSGLNWALFSGGFGEEDEMLAATGYAEVSLVGGTTYWISVYGTPQMGMTEPTMASFQLLISANLPPRPSTPPPPASSSPPPDTTPPQTTIDRSQLRAASRSAKFWFSSSEPPQGFLCQLDKGDFKSCGSPRTYKRLKPGKHTFRVKAADAAGNVDPSPAVAHFRIPRPHHGRR